MFTLFLDWRVQLSHRRGTGAALCALAVATGLVLTGCGTESEPVPTTTPTSTETAPSTPEPSKSVDTPEPTTTEPTPEPIPPDPAQLINENTEEGAKSAAKYFIALQNYALATRETTRWNHSAADDCTYCVTAATRIEELLVNDRQLQGGDVNIESFGSVEEFGAGLWELAIRVRQAPYMVIDAGGKTVDEGHPQDSDASIFVEFEQGRWLMLGLGT